jgi:hypothetical protein
MKTLKLILAAVCAALVLGAAVSGASARNFSSTSQTFRETFREVRLNLPFGITNCQMTLEGSLHSRTIAKVVGSLIGYITAARLGPCAAFTFTVLAETLPWHVQYAGFAGTLPSITRLRTDIIGFSYRIGEPRGVTCLLRSSTTEPARLEYSVGAGGTFTEVELGGAIRVGAECFGATGSLTSDRVRPTVLNSTTGITITLI